MLAWWRESHPLKRPRPVSDASADLAAAGKDDLGLARVQVGADAAGREETDGTGDCRAALANHTGGGWGPTAKPAAELEPHNGPQNGTQAPGLGGHRHCCGRIRAAGVQLRPWMPEPPLSIISPVLANQAQPTSHGVAGCVEGGGACTSSGGAAGLCNRQGPVSVECRRIGVPGCICIQSH
jgi:hypothetical protein